jgi:hypothetical protein
MLIFLEKLLQGTIGKPVKGIQLGHPQDPSTQPQ